MRFTRVTFARSMFVPGVCDGASLVSDVDADILDEGLGFHSGPKMTIVPWVHILAATFEQQAQQPATVSQLQQAANQQIANLQPPPPKKRRN